MNIFGIVNESVEIIASREAQGHELLMLERRPHPYCFAVDNLDGTGSWEDRKEIIEKTTFFESERTIATQIDIDKRLYIANITDETMQEVIVYLRSINPNFASLLIDSEPVKRPSIFEQYD